MTAPNPMSFVADWDGEHHAYPAGSVVRHTPSGKLYVATAATHKARAYRTDTFDNRLIENGWGASSSGARWTFRNMDPTDARAAAFSVQDGQGTISYDADGNLSGDGSSEWLTWGGAVGQTDLDWVLTWSYDEGSAGATGGAGLGWAVVLRSDLPWDYAAPEFDIAQHDTSGPIIVQGYVYGPSNSDNASTTQTMVLAPGTVYRTRVRSYQGAYSARTWLASDPEPVTWQVSFTTPDGDDIPAGDTYALFNWWTHLAPHQILRFDAMSIQSVVPAPPDDPAHWQSLKSAMEVVFLDAEDLVLDRAEVFVVYSADALTAHRKLTLPRAAEHAGQWVNTMSVGGDSPDMADVLVLEGDQLVGTSCSLQMISDGVDSWYGMDC